MTPTPPLSIYAREIYLARAGRRPAAVPTDLAALEAYAREPCAPEPYWYVAGSAGTRAPLRAPTARPSTTGASCRACSPARPPRDLLDHRARARAAGADHHRAGRRAGDHARRRRAGGRPRGGRARAADDRCRPCRRYALEDVAEANGDGHRWFQLYWPNDEAVCRELPGAGAARPGSPRWSSPSTPGMLGWRPHDLDHAYLPFLTGEGLATYFSRPGVPRRARQGAAEDDSRPRCCAGCRCSPAPTTPGTTSRSCASTGTGPIVLKGIQHVDDARRAVDAGMDGIVVSNHGGRQVDGAIGSLRRAARHRRRRRATRSRCCSTPASAPAPTCVKALALGAKAVLVGAARGCTASRWAATTGCEHVLRSLLADLDLTLALSGNDSIAGLGPHTLQRQ